MDLMSGYKGMVGLVFGNENTASNEDSYVERLLNRISNGVLAEDRRNAILELQSVVAESNSSQLAFGAIGFPVVINVLKEEREDVEMIRGALETLVGALTPINQVKGLKNDVQPALMNADLLSREAENISLLISLLSEDDFYVRYYTIQILTALLNNSPNRLQEAILTIPRAITRLMDMLMDREVIRNEALLLLTFLTREAEEIQKILVFEGAFDKIFSIIKEEGGSDGGVVVQDCLELLNNLLRKSASNQILLRETLGFDFLPMILRARGTAYSFTQQKTTNILYAMDTVNILLYGGLESDPSRSNNQSTNKTLLVQKKVLDCLLMLGVESRWAPISVRCVALFCIGNLVMLHPKNREALASKVLGQEPSVEPALNSILRIILRTSSVEEFIASDHIFKCFCEGNSEGQTMLASTLIPQPQMMTHAAVEDDVLMSFGSLLLHGLTMSESNGDLEICSRAASVLSHLLKDNDKCKEKVLEIKVEAPTPLEVPEPLMHRMVKYMALASSAKMKDGKAKSAEKSYLEVPILKLLVIWLANSPIAVQCFLDAGPHLTYVLELVTNSSATVCVQGLAAIILGECVIFNKCVENGKDSFAVVDAITKKVSLTSYFLKIEELMKSSIFSDAKSVHSRSPVTRSQPPGNTESENVEDRSLLSAAVDAEFVGFARTLESNIRESIVDVFSRPKHDVAIIPSELEQRNGENDKAYIARLRLFIDKQCSEMQNVVGRNAALAEDVARVGGGDGVSERFENGAMKRELEEANKRVEALRSEKMKLEMEYVKVEADLKSLSDAYNSLEEVNYNLEEEVKSLRNGRGVDVDVEEIEADALREREAEIEADALREREAEIDDLLVCLGQEQTIVKKLTARLLQLGQDVDHLLEGIGDDTLLPDHHEHHH